MGTLFSTLDIARSGMFAAQVQLDIAGHNIANVNTEGYSRQRVHLTTPWPIVRPYGQLGRGVTVAEIRRVRDEFLDRIYRFQTAGLGSAEVQAGYYQLLEDVLLEPTDSGLGVRLDQFFDALNDFANNVESYSVREVVVAEAQAVAATLNDVAERLYLLRTNANEEVRNLVPEINDLSRRIAEMNILIRDAELNGTMANDLRDERDRALDQLARLINVNYTELEDGQVTVRIGGDVLVDMTGWRELVAVPNPALDPERTDLVEVRFSDNNQLVDIRDGELHGALHIRDVVIPQLDARLDTIAATLIEQINRIQAQGNGLVNLTGTITSANAVTDPNLALTGAGLPFSITVPGTFQIALYDATTNQVVGSPWTITVNAGDSLNTLVATINATVTDPNFSAVVNADNTVSFTAAAGYSFVFSNDTTNVLTALGVNGVFTGWDARTIAVNSAIINDPGLLASAYDLNVLATGDNRAALDMAAVRNLRILDGNSSTINDFYESTVARLGSEARANRIVLETETAFSAEFDQRRRQTSDVSLDEEVTFMIQYQRAFEASARVVTVTDRMLEALLTMAL